MIPQALKNRPKLHEHDRVYFKMFGELTSSRPQGEMFGNIPVSQFKDWCELWRIDSLLERERLFKYLRRIDEAFVSHSLAKRKRELERMRQGSGGPSGAMPGKGRP